MFVNNTSSFKRALRDATIKRNSDIMEFLKIKVFKVLTHKELSKLCDIIDFKVYNVGSIIQNKGELIDNMYVVIPGRNRIYEKRRQNKVLQKRRLLFRNGPYGTSFISICVYS